MLVRNVFFTASLFAALLFAACNSEHAKQENEEAPAKETPAQAKPAPEKPKPEPAAAPAEEAPAEPALPTDPKKLELARKKAILDGKYDVALKVCAAEDVKSLGEQGILSCVLSACRQGDRAKAAAWGKLLKGALKAQAKKVCAASKVPI